MPEARAGGRALRLVLPPACWLEAWRKRRPSDSLLGPEPWPEADVELAKSVIEILDPPSIHASEDINAGSASESSEDDGFLAFGTETWVFDIAEGREQEFKDDLHETGVVLVIEEVPDESLTT